MHRVKVTKLMHILKSKGQLKDKTIREASRIEEVIKHKHKINKESVNHTMPKKNSKIQHIKGAWNKAYE